MIKKSAKPPGNPYYGLLPSLGKNKGIGSPNFLGGLAHGRHMMKSLHFIGNGNIESVELLSSEAKKMVNFILRNLYEFIASCYPHFFKKGFVDLRGPNYDLRPFLQVLLS